MSRVAWAAMFVVVLASAGCRICKSTDDYCGPAYGNGVLDHNYMARRGSILDNSAYQANDSASYSPMPSQQQQGMPTVAPTQEAPPPTSAIQTSSRRQQ